MGKPYLSPKKPREGLILYGYRGSIAHNMYVPQSDPDSIDDKDTLGIFIDHLDNYFGIPKNRNRGVWEKQQDEWDIVCYEIRKMFSLLLKCNPNVMSLLWLEDKHYIIKNPEGELLINNRNLFVSKKAYYSFTGYAHGQFKRMTAFKKAGYMGEKRKQLVEKYGYDCKNAAHLIRLLKMGIEFLSSGVLNVFRYDNDMLLSIKNGEWSLEKVKNESDRLFKLSEETYLKSKLPENPDVGGAELLLIDILRNNFKDKK